MAAEDGESRRAARGVAHRRATIRLYAGGVVIGRQKPPAATPFFPLPRTNAGIGRRDAAAYAGKGKLSGHRHLSNSSWLGTLWHKTGTA